MVSLGVGMQKSAAPKPLALTLPPLVESGSERREDNSQQAPDADQQQPTPTDKEQEEEEEEDEEEEEADGTEREDHFDVDASAEQAVDSTGKPPLRQAPDSKTTTTTSSRFSIISLPRRVRASVFSRKKKAKAVNADGSAMVDDTTDENEIETSGAWTPASDGAWSETPQSAMAGHASAASMSPSLSQSLSLSPACHDRMGSIESCSTASPSTGSSSATGATSYSKLTFSSLTSSFGSRSRSASQHPDPVDNVETFKSFWDEKLRHTMDKLAHRDGDNNGALVAGPAAFERSHSTPLDVFHVLLKLYAHQDVIQDLYQSYDANPSEFEFYIPQLCTFLLHGNYAKQHQLECFLMSRSSESLVFAHRLGWFLQAFCGGAREYQSEYLNLSVTASPEDENADLISAIRERSCVPAVLMAQGLTAEEVSEKEAHLKLRRASQFAIDRAQAMANAMAHFDEDDAAFAAFLETKRKKVIYETRPDEGTPEQLALYNAAPEFVTSLTDLADQLIGVPLAERNEKLRQGLTTVGEQVLPSNVIYLPIGNACHRVKGIQVNESFTFSTKERVPYFLCLEVVDYAIDAHEVTGNAKKSKRSLLARRRKFALKLRFKKKNKRNEKDEAANDGDTEATTVVDKGLPDDTAHSSGDEEEGYFSGGSDHEGGDRDECGEEHALEHPTKEDDDHLEANQQHDLMQTEVLALTPGMVMDTAAVAARMGVESEDDGEHGSHLDSADSAKKRRMGQWGLPRGRRRSKTRSTKTKTPGKPDHFYSSWFGKKQRRRRGGAGASSHGSEDPSASEEDHIPHDKETTDDEERDTFGEMKVHGDGESKEPAPEPKLAEDHTNDASSDDEDNARGRGRDISASLDFTDSAAWRVNFGLEDVLTDGEGDQQDGELEAPERTPEAAHERLSEDDGADEGDDEEEEEIPIIVFAEPWSEKQERLRKESPLGHHPGWRLLPVIVKSNDDLRQEQFAAQLISQCDRIFREYMLPLRLRPYNIIATTANAGLIEAVPDTVSLDSLKRNDPDYTSLLNFFHRQFGGSEAPEFRQARRNFVESLAAYSILCYIFQIKDRHNGNILLDSEGHVVHIDFGFLLTNSPGSNFNFERAPFKLTDEMVELMGGPRSATFRYFRSLCIRAYLALRRNMDKIILLVEMMLVGNSDLPCFAGGKFTVIEGLKERFKPGARTSECQVFVNQLIDRSINNWRTRWYDKYQRAYLGIL